MTNREIIRELKRRGYSRVDIDTDSRAAKTFYTYRGGLHINGTGNLSFHIVPPQDSLGLGRFAICATRNGESSQLGTDDAPFFFGRLLAFLKGERKEKEIIDEIVLEDKGFCFIYKTETFILPQELFNIFQIMCLYKRGYVNQIIFFMI